MNQQGKSQSEIESILERFTLTNPSAEQRQRIVGAAQSVWQDASVQAPISTLRLIGASAACVAVILAVDVFGAMALAPWRPHPAFHSSAQTGIDTEDFHTLVPSVRFCRGVARGMSQAKRTGLLDYRSRLNRLLDESQTGQAQKQTLPNRHQGQHLRARPLSWHG
jgi:hypothetical protein